MTAQEIREAKDRLLGIVEVAGEVTKDLSEALRESRERMEKIDAELRRAGFPPEPYSSS